MKELTFENILAVVKEQGWLVAQIQHVTMQYEAIKSMGVKSCGFQATIMEPLPPAPEKGEKKE